MGVLHSDTCHRPRYLQSFTQPIILSFLPPTSSTEISLHIVSALLHISHRCTSQIIHQEMIFFSFLLELPADQAQLCGTDRTHALLRLHFLRFCAAICNVLLM